MRAVAATAVAVAGLAAGCGAGGHAPAASGQGRQLFVRECSGCHTLTGHERGAAGGDLLLAPLSERDLASFARVMPTKDHLSVDEAQAVATYIVESRRRSTKGQR